jgi:hypothetical protein
MGAIGQGKNQAGKVYSTVKCEGMRFTSQRDIVNLLMVPSQDHAKISYCIIQHKIEKRMQRILESFQQLNSTFYAAASSRSLTEKKSSANPTLVKRRGLPWAARAANPVD